MDSKKENKIHPRGSTRTGRVWSLDKVNISVPYDGPGQLEVYVAGSNAIQLKDAGYGVWSWKGKASTSYQYGIRVGSGIFWDSQTHNVPSGCQYKYDGPPVIAENDFAQFVVRQEDSDKKLQAHYVVKLAAAKALSTCGCCTELQGSLIPMAHGLRLLLCKESKWLNSTSQNQKPGWFSWMAMNVHQQVSTYFYELVSDQVYNQVLADMLDIPEYLLFVVMTVEAVVQGNPVRVARAALRIFNDLGNKSPMRNLNADDLRWTGLQLYFVYKSLCEQGSTAAWGVVPLLRAVERQYRNICNGSDHKISPNGLSFEGKCTSIDKMLRRHEVLPALLSLGKQQSWLGNMMVCQSLLEKHDGISLFDDNEVALVQAAQQYPMYVAAALLCSGLQKCSKAIICTLPLPVLASVVGAWLREEPANLQCKASTSAVEMLGILLDELVHKLRKMQNDIENAKVPAINERDGSTWAMVAARGIAAQSHAASDSQRSFVMPQWVQHLQRSSSDGKSFITLLQRICNWLIESPQKGSTSLLSLLVNMYLLLMYLVDDYKDDRDMNSILLSLATLPKHIVTCVTHLNPKQSVGAMLTRSAALLVGDLHPKLLNCWNVHKVLMARKSFDEHFSLGLKLVLKNVPIAEIFSVVTGPWCDHVVLREAVIDRCESDTGITVESLTEALAHQDDSFQMQCALCICKRGLQPCDALLPSGMRRALQVLLDCGLCSEELQKSYSQLRKTFVELCWCAMTGECSKSKMKQIMQHEAELYDAFKLHTAIGQLTPVSVAEIHVQVTDRPVNCIQDSIPLPSYEDFNSQFQMQKRSAELLLYARDCYAGMIDLCRDSLVDDIAVVLKQFVSRVDHNKEQMKLKDCWEFAVLDPHLVGVEMVAASPPLRTIAMKVMKGKQVSDSASFLRVWGLVLERLQNVYRNLRNLSCADLPAMQAIMLSERPLHVLHQLSLVCGRTSAASAGRPRLVSPEWAVQAPSWAEGVALSCSKLRLDGLLAALVDVAEVLLPPHTREICDELSNCKELCCKLREFEADVDTVIADLAPEVGKFVDRYGLSHSMLPALQALGRMGPTLKWCNSENMLRDFRSMAEFENLALTIAQLWDPIVTSAVSDLHRVLEDLRGDYLGWEQSRHVQTVQVLVQLADRWTGTRREEQLVRRAVNVVENLEALKALKQELAKSSGNRAVDDLTRIRHSGQLELMLKADAFPQIDAAAEVASIRFTEATSAVRILMLPEAEELHAQLGLADTTGDLRREVEQLGEVLQRARHVVDALVAARLAGVPEWIGKDVQLQWNYTSNLPDQLTKQFEAFREERRKWRRQMRPQQAANLALATISVRAAVVRLRARGCRIRRDYCHDAAEFPDPVFDNISLNMSQPISTNGSYPQASFVIPGRPSFLRASAEHNHSVFVLLLDAFQQATGRQPLRTELLLCSPHMTAEDVDLFALRVLSADRRASTLLFAVVAPEQLSGQLQMRLVWKLRKWSSEKAPEALKEILSNSRDKMKLIFVTKQGAAPVIEYCTLEGAGERSLTTDLMALRSWLARVLVSKKSVMVVTSQQPGAGRSQWIKRHIQETTYSTRMDTDNISPSTAKKKGVPIETNTLSGEVTPSDFNVEFVGDPNFLEAHVIKIGVSCTGLIEVCLFEFLVLGHVVTPQGSTIARRAPVFLEMEKAHLISIFPLSTLLRTICILCPNEEPVQSSNIMDYIRNQYVFASLGQGVFRVLQALQHGSPGLIDVYSASQTISKDTIMQIAAQALQFNPVPFTVLKALVCYLDFVIPNVVRVCRLIECPSERERCLRIALEIALATAKDVTHNPASDSHVVRWEEANHLQYELFHAIALERPQLLLAGIDLPQVGSGELLQQLRSMLKVYPCDAPMPSRFSAFVLSTDLISKLLAVFHRLKTSVPLIMQGHTGCGKTSLIEFLCELLNQNLIQIRVHGGYDADRVRDETRNAVREAMKYYERRKRKSIIFFDELNTTSAIDLAKEIICDERMDGKHLNAIMQAIGEESLGFQANWLRTHVGTFQPSFREVFCFVAAINPYQRRTRLEIERFSRSGLRSEDAAQMTELLYRVHPLTPSLRHFVFDCGQMSPELEQVCIKEQVRKKLVDTSHHDQENAVHFLGMVLSCCHMFMRSDKSDCRFVSFRDVNHATKVFAFVRDTLGLMMEDAALLAACTCYAAKLEDRSNLYAALAAACSRTAADIEDFFSEQKLKLAHAATIPQGDGISINDAFAENLFMLVICTQLKIPLFIVGPPGSSKSLAKTVFSQTFDSPDRREPFNRMRATQCLILQCSPHTRAADVQAHFERAQKHGKVVILEEAGLAEMSPDAPLKILHEIFDAAKGEVAFVAMSNWRLDPAKMNRGIFVTRSMPDEGKLVQSAVDVVQQTGSNDMRAVFEAIARGLLELCEQSSFFALRDFYSCISLLRGIDPTANPERVWQAVLRNFSGLPANGYKENPALSAVDDLFHRQFASCTGFIPEVLQDVAVRPPALELLCACFNDPKHSRYPLVICEHPEAAVPLLQARGVLPERMQILCGSAFAEDQGLKYLLHVVSKVKHCLEFGLPMVLVNLEKAYESLYDVLNKFYWRTSDGRQFVDLAISSASFGQNRALKVQVDPKFQLMVIASSKDAYERFPPPLLNRFEKHYLSEDVDCDDASDLMRQMLQWVESLALPTDSLVGVGCMRRAVVTLTKSANMEELSESDAIERLQRLLLRIAAPEHLCACPNELEMSANDLQRHSLGAALACLWEEGASFVLATSFCQSAPHVVRDVVQQRSDGGVKVLCAEDFHTEKQFEQEADEFLQLCDSSGGVLVVQVSATMPQLINNIDFILRSKRASGNRNKVRVVMLLTMARGVHPPARSFDGFWSHVHIDAISDAGTLDIVKLAHEGIPHGEACDNLVLVLLEGSTDQQRLERQRLGVNQELCHRILEQLRDGAGSSLLMPSMLERAALELPPHGSFSDRFAAELWTDISKQFSSVTWQVGVSPALDELWKRLAQRAPLESSKSQFPFASWVAEQIDGVLPIVSDFGKAIDFGLKRLQSDGLTDLLVLNSEGSEMIDALKRYAKDIEGEVSASWLVPLVLRLRCHGLCAQIVALHALRKAFRNFLNEETGLQLMSWAKHELPKYDENILHDGERLHSSLKTWLEDCGLEAGPADGVDDFVDAESFMESDASDAEGVFDEVNNGQGEEKDQPELETILPSGLNDQMYSPKDEAEVSVSKQQVVTNPQDPASAATVAQVVTGAIEASDMELHGCAEDLPGDMSAPVRRAERTSTAEVQEVADVPAPRASQADAPEHDLVLRTQASFMVAGMPNASTKNDAIQRIRHELFAEEHIADPRVRRMRDKFGRLLNKIAYDLGSKATRFVFELLQNFDDNSYGQGVVPEVDINQLSESELQFCCNEIGFTERDLESITDVVQSKKTLHPGAFIGEKGLGFKSIFRASKAPSIVSGPYEFGFRFVDGDPLSLVTPVPLTAEEATNIRSTSSGATTTIHVPLWQLSAEQVLKDLDPLSLLFFRKLRVLRVSNDEAPGSVKEWTLKVDGHRKTLKKSREDGSMEKRSFWVCEHEFEVPQDVMMETPERTGVLSSKIVLAFPESEAAGTYFPVYNFLLIRDFGLPFVLNGDFLLTTSREHIHEDRRWCRMVRDHLVPAFLQALETMRSSPLATRFLSLVPTLRNLREGFFSTVVGELHQALRKIACIPTMDGTWTLPCKVLWPRSDDTFSWMSSLQEDVDFLLGWKIVHNHCLDADKELREALGIERRSVEWCLEHVISQHPDHFASKGDDWFIRLYRFLSVGRHELRVQMRAKLFPAARGSELLSARMLSLGNAGCSNELRTSLRTNLDEALLEWMCHLGAHTPRPSDKLHVEILPFSQHCSFVPSPIESAQLDSHLTWVYENRLQLRACVHDLGKLRVRTLAGSYVAAGQLQLPTRMMHGGMPGLDECMDAQQQQWKELVLSPHYIYEEAYEFFTEWLGVHESFVLEDGAFAPQVRAALPSGETCQLQLRAFLKHLDHYWVHLAPHMEGEGSSTILTMRDLRMQSNFDGWQLPLRMLFHDVQKADFDSILPFAEPALQLSCGLTEALGISLQLCADKLVTWLEILQQRHSGLSGFDGCSRLEPVYRELQKQSCKTPVPVLHAHHGWLSASDERLFWAPHQLLDTNTTSALCHAYPGFLKDYFIGIGVTPTLSLRAALEGQEVHRDALEGVLSWLNDSGRKSFEQVRHLPIFPVLVDGRACASERIIANDADWDVDALCELEDVQVLDVSNLDRMSNVLQWAGVQLLSQLVPEAAVSKTQKPPALPPMTPWEQALIWTRAIEVRRGGAGVRVLFRDQPDAREAFVDAGVESDAGVDGIVFNSQGEVVRFLLVVEASRPMRPFSSLMAEQPSRYVIHFFSGFGSKEPVHQAVCGEQPSPYLSIRRELELGAGDFSFAAAVAKERQSAAGMVVTTPKAPRAAQENINVIKHHGGEVRHDISASTASSLGKFDLIVFNFPHTGMQQYGVDMDGLRRSIDSNKELLHEIFAGCRDALQPGGRLQVTLKDCFPYIYWDINRLASDNHWRFVRAFPFESSHWQHLGYKHQTTRPTSIGSVKLTNATTYEFCTRE